MGGIKMVEEDNNSCIFPRCPQCEKGYLLPFSFKEDVFEKWKCTAFECGFVLKKHENR